MVERLVVSAEVPASTCGTVAIGRGTYDVHRAWTLHLADAASYFPVTRILPPEHRLSFGAEAERTVCDWAHAQRLILLLHDADDLQIVANAFTRTVPGARVDLPEGVAALRQELDTTLSDTTRALSLTVLAAGSFIVAALAATNARDEARHMARSRALGATKGDLAAMLAAQTLAPVALGVLVGLAVAGATAAVWRVRLGADVYLAVSALMALSSGSVTALVVAWAASRDPAARLRIP
jgi:predicted lysophospholipase L1 biosynthesis ABC-type transport system permease subunit